MSAILPLDQARDTVELYLPSVSPAGRAIYLAALLVLTAALAALPLVHVAVAVRSPGVIRSSDERHAVGFAVAGQVDSVFVRVGQPVQAGQLLATVRDAAAEQRFTLLSGEADELRDRIGDLGRMLPALRAAPVVRLAASRDRAEYAQFRAELRDAALDERKARAELDRARALAARGFATSAALEDAQYAVSSAVRRGEAARARYRRQWRDDLADRQRELGELELQLQESVEARAMLSVRAPIAGTVEELAGVSAGSRARAGDPLAVISPGGPVIAEAYVSPRDIGLVHVGAPVRLQVDAYDFNQWGVLTGRVLSIGDDADAVGGQLAFRVRCALAAHHLSLPNGARGLLRKGMTLQARFVVADRTLFQLLFDDLSDWLDPRRAPAAAAAGPAGAAVGTKLAGRGAA